MAWRARYFGGQDFGPQGCVALLDLRAVRTLCGYWGIGVKIRNLSAGVVGVRLRFGDRDLCGPPGREPPCQNGPIDDGGEKNPVRLSNQNVRCQMKVFRA